MLISYCRNVNNRTYEATTWQIVFELGMTHVNENGNYTLQLALASAQEAELQVSCIVVYTQNIRT